MLTSPGDTIEASDFIRKDEQSADPTDDAERVPKIEPDGRVHADFTMPAGIYFPFAGASGDIPAGFLLCDGSAVSRTTYADLFAAIGTLWGAGNGTTTFNVPNLKGRVPVGYDASQTEFDAVAENGGAKTHTLVEAEMPTHNHNVPADGGTDNSGGPYARYDGGSSGAGVTTSSKGSGSAHNNLQPYTVSHFIIKT
jgi:microcystin-dependent protein